MVYIFYFWFFLFGLIIGSFLNVLILRYHTGITIFGRSFCFSCGHKLSWKDLFPLASYVFLKGKCRFCKSDISKQYVTVEILTGILFTLVFWKLGGPESLLNSLIAEGTSPYYFFEFLFFSVIFSILLIIGAYDLKHKIIPDSFAFVFAGLALFRVLFLPETFLFVPTFWDLLAGPILALPLALLWWYSDGRWIGLGDAKLSLGIGWFLGLANGFASIVLSFWVGAIVGVLLILAEKMSRKASWGKKVTLKSEVPFAPFLILGFYAAAFFPALATAVFHLFV